MPPLASSSPEKLRPSLLAPHHSLPASVLPVLSLLDVDLSLLCSPVPCFRFQIETCYSLKTKCLLASSTYLTFKKQSAIRGAIKLSVLREKFMEVPPNATEVELDQHARVYALYVLGFSLFSSSSKGMLILSIFHCFIIRGYIASAHDCIVPAGSCIPTSDKDQGLTHVIEFEFRK
ncbi:hypothetical protein P8452_20990 [Trifolium repens]|nr:hypothetical protein P8452_20990 [Trifolium repens]